MSESPLYEDGTQFKLIMRSNNYNKDDEDGDVNNNNKNNNDDDERSILGKILLDSW